MLLIDSCTLSRPRVISGLSRRAYAPCHEEQNDHPSACPGLMCGMIDAWAHVDFPSVLWSFHQSGTAGTRIHLYFQSARCFCPLADQSNLFNWENVELCRADFFFFRNLFHQKWDPITVPSSEVMVSQHGPSNIINALGWFIQASGEKSEAKQIEFRCTNRNFTSPDGFSVCTLRIGELHHGINRKSLVLTIFQSPKKE